MAERVLDEDVLRRFLAKEFSERLYIVSRQSFSAYHEEIFVGVKEFLQLLKHQFFCQTAVLFSLFHPTTCFNPTTFPIIPHRKVVGLIRRWRIIGSKNRKIGG